MEDGNLWFAIIVTIVLIGINGMLASAEIAVVGLNELKLRKQAGEGDKKSALLLEMKQNPSDFLSTIQIGITLAGLLSGAFAADSLAAPIVSFAASHGMAGAALTAVRLGSVVLITLILTGFMIVFGELVPKRVAMARPEATARRVVPLIAGLKKATIPLVRLLSYATNGVLRLVGISSEEGNSLVTEEEILMMVKEGRDQGTIEESEMELVKNVFAFTDMTAHDIMIHRTEIIALPIETPLSEALQLMVETKINKFPIFEGNIDRIIGVLYARDIIAEYPGREQGLQKLTVKEMMRKPLFVPESKRLYRLFTEMKQSGERIAIVADEFGGTSGMVTLTDIIEEIVGDIEASIDEEVVLTEDGDYLFDGLMRMEDVLSVIVLDVDPDEFDTLSGFVIHQLGYVPAEEERAEVTYGGYRFKILEMERTHIKRVKVERIGG